jgi:cytoskeletal protein RodZ
MEPINNQTPESEVDQSLSKPADRPSSHVVIITIMVAIATLLAIGLFVANNQANPQTEPAPSLPPTPEQPATLSTEELDEVRKTLPTETNTLPRRETRVALEHVATADSVTPTPNATPPEAPEAGSVTTGGVTFGEVVITGPSDQLVQKVIKGMVFTAPDASHNYFVLSTQTGPYTILYTTNTQFVVQESQFAATGLLPGDMVEVNGSVALGDTRFNAERVEITGTLELGASSDTSN